MDTAQTEKNRKKGIYILLILIILLLTSVVLFLLNVQQEEEIVGGRREAAALQGSLNLMSEEEIQEAMDRIVEEGMFRISIAATILTTPEGKAQVRIENNIQNRYLMKVRITLNENQQEIYETGMIDPGYYIMEADLNRSFEPGNYPATAVFSAYDPQTEDLIGRVGAAVDIRVLEKTP